MIERLTIQNFQAHKNLTIDFDIGITSIVGSSDVGKSAIIRALKWICFNRPSGTSFIRHGQDMCSVTIDTDGHRITRKKEKTENSYAIEESVMKALGKDVPEAVQNILQVGTINFQDQHDAPFWFNLSAGEVSKNLNAIVDLSAMDKSNAYIAKEINSTKARADLLEEQQGAWKKTIQSLNVYRDIKTSLNSLNSLKTQHSTTAVNRASLSDLLEGVSLVGGRADRLNLALKSGAVCTRLGAVCVGVSQEREKLQKILIVIGEFQGILKAPQPSLVPVEGAFQCYTDTGKRMMSLQKGVALGEGIERTQQKLAEEIKQIEDTIQKTFKGRCPLCGKKMW